MRRALLAVVACSLVGATPALRTQLEDAAEIVVPGGMGFVASSLGMAFDPARDDPSRFMERVAALLQEPGMFPRALVLRRYLEDLDELRRLLDDAALRFPSGAPSLAAAGSESYERAERILGFLGVQVRRGEGVVSLALRRGETHERRRRMAEHLGFDVGDHLAALEAGEAIDISVRNDAVPLLFGAEEWRKQVFGTRRDGHGLFRQFIVDSRPRRLLLGFSRVDDATREHLFRSVGLGDIYENDELVDGFERVSPYLRVAGGQIRLPGGDARAWQALLGPWSDDRELLFKLFTAGNGRAMQYWRALTLLDEPVSRYLLTGNGVSAADRENWAMTLFDAMPRPKYGDTMRWPWDFAELAVHLRLAGEGGIAWPGGRRAWLAAVRSDEVIGSRADLDAELRRVAGRPADPSRADVEILAGLLSHSNPDHRNAADRAARSGPRRYLAVTAALRYQPAATAAHVVPLLYRAYPRYGAAFGFLVMPQALAPETVEAFIFQLQEADRIGQHAGRTEALRQLQAMHILLRHMVLNGAIPAGEADHVLTSFFRLPLAGEPGTFGVTQLGLGPGLLRWCNETLAPALERGGIEDAGTPGKLTAALIGRVTPVPLSIGGIAYIYDPSSTQRETMERHLRQMQAPPLEYLFALDALADRAAAVIAGHAENVAGVVEPFASRVGAATTPGDGPFVNPDEVASALEESLDRFLEAVPPPALGRHEQDSLRAPFAPRDLRERVARLAANLRSNNGDVADADRVRNAVSAWMGDALSALVYAVHMGDPDSLSYRDRPLSWAHSFDGDFGPPLAAERRGLEPTAEIVDPQHGSVLAHSLFGVAPLLGTWNLEDIARRRSQAPLGDALQLAWGATLTALHLPSLTVEAHAHVVRFHDAGTEWLRRAASACDPRTASGASPELALSEALRRLLQSGAWQLAVDAVEQGDEAAAMRLVSAGNRYLLGSMLDTSDDESDPFLRFARDQTVGLWSSRPTDYLGLERPLLLPYGEAGDTVGDPLLYARIIDVRVALSLALDELGLEPLLHAAVLPLAMSDVLASIRPDTQVAWDELLVAIPERVTAEAVNGWIEELAFAGAFRSPATSDPSPR